ncbi:MAG: hypothetical protein K1X57_00180 [Gemmataceae bacterium]|nr:hypothetical protein [Gemmataceae bacterium]
MMRFLIKSVLVLSGLLTCGWFAARAVMQSDMAANRVASRISAALGTKVTVGGLQVGLDGSILTDVAVYELDATTGQQPFVTIGRVETDVGLTDLVSGSNDPSRVSLIDLHVVVRHDREGHLLTKTPQPAGADRPLPTIRLTRAGVTIKKDGEPDVSFRGLDGEVNEASGQVAMQGTIVDPAWGGKWAVAGAAPKAGGVVALHLKSPGVSVTQEMLRRVPYVPVSVWSHVELAGQTPVDLQLQIPPAPAKTRYRVALTPANTSVYVPSIDLRAATAAGQVLVEDGVVLLRDVRGKVAEGELHVSGAVLDFRPSNGSNMKFEFDATRLILQSLPAKWKLPPRLGGKLSGTMTLNVRIIDRIPILTGSGDGRVDDAMIGPIPFPNYGLRFRADQNGFLFEPRLGR